MTFSQGYKARVLLGDLSMSPKLSDVSLPFSVEMLDVTTFADDGVKRFIPGLGSSTSSMSGFMDSETLDEMDGFTSTSPLTYGPRGLAHSAPLFLVDTLKATVEVGSQVAGVSSFTLSGQTDGVTDIGVSLHDLEAETGDGNDSNFDGSASSAAGAAGHLHVTAFSGFSAVDVAIQHSANGSTGWSDLIAFTQVSGTTSERVEVAGSVNRYVRAEWAKTGTGSITFQVGFSRR